MRGTFTATGTRKSVVGSASVHVIVVKEIPGDPKHSPAYTTPKLPDPSCFVSAILASGISFARCSNE